MKQSPLLTAVLSLAALEAAPLCFAQTDFPAEAAGSKAEVRLNDGFSVEKGIDRHDHILMPEDVEENESLRSVPENPQDDDSALTEEQIVEDLQSFIDTFQQRMATEAAANLKRGKSFMAQFAGQQGVTTTKSGLMYRVLTKGEGRRYDRATDGEEAIVSVTYEGKTIDGRTFDMAEEPIRMGINQAVPGFTEALKTMPVGSEWEICIPADLAYGEQTVGPIEAYSTLLFTLTLHDIITLPPAPPRGTTRLGTPQPRQEQVIETAAESPTTE